MDTLILVQDAKDIQDGLAQDPPHYPLGGEPRWRPAGPGPMGPLAPDLKCPYEKLRVPADDADIAAVAKIVADKIIAYADDLLGKEPRRIPHPRDIVTFRLIIMFHQNSHTMAKAIADGLLSLAKDPAWLTLPDKRTFMLQVKDIWLLSCESGAEVTSNTPLLHKYIEQSLGMRLAAQVGLFTEVKPPPSNPKEYFPVPAVYEFSTGDPVTGAMRMHPNKAEFARTPHWELTPDGDIEEQQPPIVPDPEFPSGGTIYKWDKFLAPPGQTQIPDGGMVDILAQP